MPDPAPADDSGRLRVAVAASGAHMKALATPIRAIGSSSSQIVLVAVVTRLSQNSEAEHSASPNAVMVRGWMRSVSLPATGASAPDEHGHRHEQQRRPGRRQAADDLGVEHEREGHAR